jgi:ADP-ribose pyrophosphatase
MAPTIPKHAKVVFKGIRFDVYHWRQRLRNGSYTTFEGVRRHYGVRVLPVIGNKIFVAKERLIDGRTIIGTFGGLVEKNESPLSAAKRELLEESGLKSKRWKLIQVEEPIRPEGVIDWKAYLFIARDCKKVARQKLDISEDIEIKAVTLEQLLQISSTWGEFDLKVLREARQSARGRDKLRKFLFG